MLPVTSQGVNMSQGAYFQYEIQTSFLLRICEILTVSINIRRQLYGDTDPAVVFVVL